MKIKQCNVDRAFIIHNRAGAQPHPLRRPDLLSLCPDSHDHLEDPDVNPVARCHAV